MKWWVPKISVSQYGKTAVITDKLVLLRKQILKNTVMCTRFLLKVTQNLLVLISNDGNCTLHSLPTETIRDMLLKEDSWGQLKGQQQGGTKPLKECPGH